MTAVPRRPDRVKKADTRTYTWDRWAKAYAAWLLVFPLYCGLWLFAKVFKKLPQWAVRKLLREHNRITETRPMDFRIPPNEAIPAYMRRWWRIARNAFFNIYYHIVLRSDDDRALHDHPWWNFSIVLEGGYYEHMIDAGGIHRRTWYGPGSVRFRPAGVIAHRLELAQDYARNNQGEPSLDEFPVELPVKTIFITGPVLRRWGFHHPTQWVDAYDWDAFCDRHNIGGMRMDGGSDAVQSERNKL